MIKDLGTKKKNFLKKKGFTLVELLIVIAILAIMAVIMIGTIDPIALVNRSRDSRRKNDLNKIKIAFEAYFNDKGEYPKNIDVAHKETGWNRPENCGKKIPSMSTYLKYLPCDPNKNTYEITIANEKTFTVLANLENKKDKDIPKDWYLPNTYYNFSQRKNEINYGVSSTNILWYESTGVDPTCGWDCFIKVGGGACSPMPRGVTCISGGGTFCFRGDCTGNDMGALIPGVEPLRQCHVESCCSGSACD